MTTTARARTTTPSPIHIQRTAAEASGVLAGRFRRATRLEEDRGHARRVARAVTSAKQGDREAIRFLYVQYADNVYGYVASIVCDEHDAEDVTQQVFAKLMRILPKYEERDVPFSAWILRVARNAALDFMRQRRAIPCAEVRDPDVGCDVGSDDRSLTLREALGGLPAEQREVVVLRHVVGLSPKEIATRMGKSESSIHGLHHRGRGALRAELAARSAGPTVAA